MADNAEKGERADTVDRIEIVEQPIFPLRIEFLDRQSNNGDQGHGLMDDVALHKHA